MAKNEGGAIPSVSGLTGPAVMVGAGAAVTVTGAIISPHEHMLIPIGVTIGAIGGGLLVFDGMF